jgi:geranylgeranyl pyrophosphate synthase
MSYINRGFEDYFVSIGNEVTELLTKVLLPEKQLKHLKGSSLLYPFSREYLETGHTFDYEFTALRGLKAGSPPKRLRPFIVINVGLGRKISDRESLYNVALAPEILHNSTLVHDDIHDYDETRSNEPTVRKKWYDYLEGKVPDEERWHIADAMAIDSGDRLQHLPYLAVSESKFDNKQKVEAVTAISKAIQDITRGQDLDMSFARRVDDIISDRIKEEEIYAMYELKTGALFELCAHLGLIFSNGTAEQKYHATLWARKYLNLRFQIHDDFIENSIDGKKGKQAGKDIAEGKLTPLVIRTLKKGPPYSNIMLQALGNRNATQEQIDGAIAAMHDSGTVKELRAFKDLMFEEGRSEVGQMGLIKPFDTYLIDLTEYVGVRTR